MVNEKLSMQKELYRKAEVEVIYFPAEDIVTASPFGSTLQDNQKGDGVSKNASDFYWWN